MHILLYLICKLPFINRSFFEIPLFYSEFILKLNSYLQFLRLYLVISTAFQVQNFSLGLTATAFNNYKWVYLIAFNSILIAS